MEVQLPRLSCGFGVLILGWSKRFWGAQQLRHTDLPSLQFLLAAQPHEQA